MSKFAPEEIDGLKQGGNDVARQRWLHGWSNSDFPTPEANDEHRIREWIRVVYEEKRWTRHRHRSRSHKVASEADDEEDIAPQRGGVGRTRVRPGRSSSNLVGSVRAYFPPSLD